MHAFRFACGCLLLAGWTSVAAAQAPAPPRPAKYQATLRYQISAPRDQHVIFYDRLIAALQGLGFEFTPPLEEHAPTDRIDPSKNMLRGLIPAANVGRLRQLPHVAGLVLAPVDLKMPEDPQAPVRIRIELVSGLPADRQLALGDQTALLLKELGFIEAPGYDQRGDTGLPYTELQGTIPAAQLDVLLKDLRTQPGGWFAPRIAPGALPHPLQQLNPIRYVEVLPDPDPVRAVATPTPRTPDYLGKIGPELWRMLEEREKDKTAAIQAVRVQVVFAGVARPETLATVRALAPGAFVEGVLGHIVSAQIEVPQVPGIAAAADVIAVRLPPAPRIGVAPTTPTSFEPAKVLAQSGVAALHQRGRRGQGIRLAIVDTDFRGWEALVKANKLPAKTRLVDLTAERTVDLQPMPPLPGAETGHGTQLARAAAVAAPEAEIVLVRLPDTDHYQLTELGRYVRGGITSPLIEKRLDEVQRDAANLADERRQLAKERAALREDFRDESEIFFEFGFLGPVYGWIMSERAWLQDRLVYLIAQERELAEREARYWNLVRDIQSLKGIPLVVAPFVWNDAYPLGGASPLSRALDAAAAGDPLQPVSRALDVDPLTAKVENCGPLWFVPSGNHAGQVWHGLFRDADRNGFMEFIPLTDKLPAGRWSPELNFLTWQPYAGKATTTLPAKARLRLALQWREPHDPDYYLRGAEDPYRQPLAGLRLTLLRQRDPDAKTLGADAFDVVARSPELPTRLEHLPSSTVYEQLLDWTIDQPGRYAVQIEHTPATQWALVHDQGMYRFMLLEGLKATGIRPLMAPTLPAIERNWELRPRLFVDSLEATNRSGRPILEDFATREGSVGIPADAREVVSVGAVGLDDRAQPYSVIGSLPLSTLAARPTVFTYDALREAPGGAWGTSLATAYAAGSMAAWLSGGGVPDVLPELLERQRGRVLRLTP